MFSAEPVMTQRIASQALALIGAFVILAALPGPAAAQRRDRTDSDGGATSGQAVPREAAPAPAPAPAAAPSPQASPAPAREPGQAVQRSSPRSVEPNGSGGSSSTSQATGARSRQGRQSAGRAVPRGSVPSPRTNTTVFVPVNYYRGYWPWGFGGLGFGSYYGSYYGGFYDPYYPWYGGYSSYGYYGYPSSYSGYATGGFEGSLRLKIKPRDAQVYVDGYYAGIVDDFDGVLQRLHVEAGPHRIEIRAPGYETLSFDVRVRFDDTTKLEADMRRIQP
jgi:hypothetical protein